MDRRVGSEDRGSVNWGRPNSRVTSSHLDHSSGSRAFISSSKRPCGFHMPPDQRRQGAQVSWRELVGPLWLRQHLLEHGRVDIQPRRADNLVGIRAAVISDGLAEMAAGDTTVGSTPSDGIINESRTEIISRKISPRASIGLTSNGFFGLCLDFRLSGSDPGRRVLSGYARNTGAIPRGTDVSERTTSLLRFAVSRPSDPGSAAALLWC